MAYIYTNVKHAKSSTGASGFLFKAASGHIAAVYSSICKEAAPPFFLVSAAAEDESLREC